MTKLDADALIIGAGPAGVIAALRAAELGARTALVTRDAFGGMAANDGPIPVRTLAHAARLLREARQLALFGISASEPLLDYNQLTKRVRAVVSDVQEHSILRQHLEAAGVGIHEHSGTARFVDPHRIKTAGGLEITAAKIILCSGGTNRRLPVAGAEFASNHSSAWGLKSPPSSLLVIGAGATGAQIASVFNAFGPPAVKPLCALNMPKQDTRVSKFSHSASN